MSIQGDRIARLVDPIIASQAKILEAWKCYRRGVLSHGGPSLKLMLDISTALSTEFMTIEAGIKLINRETDAQAQAQTPQGAAQQAAQPQPQTQGGSAPMPAQRYRARGQP